MSKASGRLEMAAHLAAVLTEESSTTGAHARNSNSHIVARHVVEIMRIALRMENLALRQCNGPWNDGDDERAERARAKALARLKAIGADYGIKSAHVYGDPRGFVVRLDLASGRKNGWGDGWGVMGA
jgi:hypothetical protein